MSAVRPVDRLLQLYNLALAGVWVPLANHAPWAPWVLGAHVAAIALPWLLAAASDRSRALGRLHDLYPLLWLAAFFGELDLVYVLAGNGPQDAAVALLDRVLFGSNVNAVWMPAMPQVWLSESLHFVYVSYYAMLVVPPLVLIWQGRSEALRDLTWRLLLTYLVCFACYLAFPVDGPGAALPRPAGPLTQGWFYSLSHTLNAAGTSAGTAFPSSHVAGAVTLAWIGWRWLPRWVAGIMALQAAGVFAATVYTQNHYLIDAVGGLLLALAMQGYGVRWAARVLGGSAGGGVRRERALATLAPEAGP
ncbi:MAG TPA: phosphatase PAP2 family protein [Gemmatimonadales bacterium]|nr:phosphatase PAP2 family protein [Gemmatimonadales bacterium]